MRRTEPSTAADFRLVLDAAAKASNLERLNVKEDQLREQLVLALNRSVMHETTLHRAGRLHHTQIASTVEFSGAGVKAEKVRAAFGRRIRAGPKTMVFNTGNGRVRRLLFTDAERDAARIRRLALRLKALDPKLRIGFARKNYPVEFGLDDVHIGEHAHD